MVTEKELEKMYREHHNWWCMICEALVRYDEIKKGKCPHCGYANLRPATDED